MIVRQARPEDAGALVAFWNPWIETTAITFSTDLKTAQGVAADIAARGAAFQVAEDQGQLIGLATYFPFRSGPGYRFTKEHSVILAPRGPRQGRWPGADGGA